MNRWVLWTVMLMLGTALTTSCGDDGGDDGSPAAGTGGSPKAGNGGDPMKIECNTAAGEVVCGRSCCGSDDPMTPACCSDDVDGLCGMSVSAFGGTPACVPMVETFAGCPSLTIPVVNFKIPSCCTADKMCGLEGTLFGMPGCTELGEAAMRAMQAFMRPMTMTPMPSDEDGGVAGAGGSTGGSAGSGGRSGGGFLPMFPPPQACPSN